MALDVIDFPHIIMIGFIGVNAASVLYVLLAIRSVHAFSLPETPAGGFQPAVTIMKPVCGMDADLYENLRSFCLQDYPRYQIVYGVRDRDDAAIPAIRRLIAEFPRLDMELVVNDNSLGSNLKVGNLDNMYAAAKHRFLVIADSDTRVEPHYLSAVIAPFEGHDVGVVTCLYRGTAAGGMASLLVCMLINESFLPSVLVSAQIREVRFAMGATMVVRRRLLDDMGGFKRL
ncbi:MAG TPA: glycosyltransferase, partial [Alphaproteobacteria bacterium]|nr:glycosyltransferase [Alphaproteobacteria bacterium]